MLTNEFVALYRPYPASKFRNYCSIVPNPFDSIDWDAIDEIREEARRNAMAAADVVAGAEASTVVAREVAATTVATVTVDAAAAATTGGVGGEGEVEIERDMVLGGLGDNDDDGGSVGGIGGGVNNTIVLLLKRERGGVRRGGGGNKRHTCIVTPHYTTPFPHNTPPKHTDIYPKKEATGRLL